MVANGAAAAAAATAAAAAADRRYRCGSRTGAALGGVQRGRDGGRQDRAAWRMGAGRGAAGRGERHTGAGRRVQVLVKLERKTGGNRLAQRRWCVLFLLLRVCFAPVKYEHRRHAICAKECRCEMNSPRVNAHATRATS